MSPDVHTTTIIELCTVIRFGRRRVTKLTEVKFGDLLLVIGLIIISLDRVRKEDEFVR